MLKDLSKKIALGLLSFSLFQSCGFLKTISINSAELSMPLIDKKVKFFESVDYGEMSWLKAKAHVKTPSQAWYYLYSHIGYDSLCSYNSFKATHNIGKGDVITIPFMAAGLLEDNGYPPIIVGLKGKSLQSLLYIYRTNEGFSALGYAPMLKSYPHIKDLIKDFENEYFCHPKKYFIMNLNENSPNNEWMNSNEILNKRVSPWGYKKIRYKK